MIPNHSEQARSIYPRNGPLRVRRGTVQPAQIVIYWQIRCFQNRNPEGALRKIGACVFADAQKFLSNSVQLLRLSHA